MPWTPIRRPSATITATIGRRARAYQVSHLPLRHAPYGTWVVRFAGRTIGSQLSHPSVDDCEQMFARYQAEQPGARVEPAQRRERTSYGPQLGLSAHIHRRSA